MSLPHSSETDVEIDVRALFRSLWRKLGYIILFVLLVGAGTYYLLMQIAPLYVSQSSVLIEAGEADFTRQSGAATPAAIDREEISSQVQLILSRDLARAVTSRLDFESREEFNPPPGQSLVDRALALLGVEREQASQPAEEVVLGTYYSRLAVYPVDNSRVIAIEFSSEDPELAAATANAIAEEYLVLQRAAKRSATSEAAAWLSSQIFDLRSKVQEAEAKVETYRAANDLFPTTGGEGSSTLPQQQLADLNAELTRVRGVRAEAEAKSAQLRSALGAGTALNVSDVINSPFIQRLLEQQVTLRTQMADLNATLLPGHPRMRALGAQIADLDRQIATEAQKVLQASEADARLAEAREREILASVTGLKSTAATANDASVELRALEREAAAQRDLLESYLSRYREALAREQSDSIPADARVISRAAVPLEPTYPKKTQMTVATMLAASILAVAFVLLRELLSGRPMRRVVYAPAGPALQASAPPPSFTAEPPARWPDDRSVRRMMADDPTLAPEVVDRVEASLGSLARDIAATGEKRVLVTLAEGSNGAGRPLGAVALARALSRNDSRVVLVDFRSDGANALSMGESDDLPGFSDLFGGNASFAQVIFRDRKSRVHFIPAGRRAVDAELVSQEQCETILSALTLTYDFVVFDAGDDVASTLAPQCGVAVVVSRFPREDERTERAFARIAAVSDVPTMLMMVDGKPGGGPDERRSEQADAGKAA